MPLSSTWRDLSHNFLFLSSWHTHLRPLLLQPLANRSNDVVCCPATEMTCMIVAPDRAAMPIRARHEGITAELPPNRAALLLFRVNFIHSHAWCMIRSQARAEPSSRLIAGSVLVFKTLRDPDPTPFLLSPFASICILSYTFILKLLDHFTSHKTTMDFLNKGKELLNKGSSSGSAQQPQGGAAPAQGQQAGGQDYGDKGMFPLLPSNFLSLSSV